MHCSPCFFLKHVFWRRPDGFRLDFLKQIFSGTIWYIGRWFWYHVTHSFSWKGTRMTKKSCSITSGTAGQKPYLAGGPAPAIVLLNILTSNQHAILLLVWFGVRKMLVVELHGESWGWCGFRGVSAKWYYTFGLRWFTWQACVMMRSCLKGYGVPFCLKTSQRLKAETYPHGNKHILFQNTIESMMFLFQRNGDVSVP